MSRSINLINFLSRDRWINNFFWSDLVDIDEPLIFLVDNVKEKEREFFLEWTDNFVCVYVFCDSHFCGCVLWWCYLLCVCVVVFFLSVLFIRSLINVKYTNVIKPTCIVWIHRNHYLESLSPHLNAFPPTNLI